MLLLLLMDEYQLPNWFPADLFSIDEPHLPENWSFKMCINAEHGLQAVWGYEELIFDEAHHDDLLERDPEALRVFYEKALKA